MAALQGLLPLGIMGIGLAGVILLQRSGRRADRERLLYENGKQWENILMEHHGILVPRTKVDPYITRETLQHEEFCAKIGRPLVNNELSPARYDLVMPGGYSDPYRGHEGEVLFLSRELNVKRPDDPPVPFWRVLLHMPVTKSLNVKDFPEFHERQRQLAESQNADSK